MPGYQNLPWVSGVANTISIDGLGVGTCNFTIMANDGVGGISQDIVLVNVTSTPASPGPNELVLILVLIIFVVGLFLAVILATRKRRKGTRRKNPGDDSVL